MATTDQGGLNWKLTAEDGFSSTLEKFTSLVREAKNAMDAFKGDKSAFTASVEQLKQLTELTKAQTAASREGRTTQNQANREELQQQRELAAAIKARAQAEKERGAIIRAQKSDQEAAARSALALDAAIAKGAATTKTVGEQATKTGAATKGMTAQLNSLRQALLGGGEAGNRLVFTLRNIIGVGAGLVFIQKIQQGFSDLVRSGITFNAQIEDTTVGIAGLLSAVVDVKNEQGQLVTGAAAFNATQVVAEKQVEKLRQATLRTTATFEQLADTFQVAVAPGLKAGLDVDQIRELAVSVAQAAGALGVPTNQLSEEIRALLTGTIQARTTRIATALGIRPEDIARAKNDVGGLAKFLDDRFKAFEIAGERAAGTFTGTFNRARIAISLAAGDASKPLFEEIRTTFLSAFDAFTTRDVFGNLLPDPKAVQVLRAVFDGIADAIKTVRTNLQQLSFEQILASAESIGSIFRGIGQVLSGFITGAINGFSTLSRIFRELFGSNADLTDLAARLGEIITVVGVIGTAFSGMRLIVSTLILPLTAIIQTVQTLGAVLKVLGLTNPFVILLVSAVALGFQIRELIALQEELNTVAEASTPEQQLSRAAILRQKLIDLQKEETVLLKERTFQLQNGIDETLIGKQLFDLRAKIKETEKLLEIQAKADKINPKAGEALNTIKPPEFTGDNDLLDKISEFASKVTGALQTAFDDQPPVSPNIKTESGKVTAQAEDDAKLVTKITLDKYGEALQKIGDLTEAGLNVMRSAISEFGSFVADVLVDAFDPTNDTTFKERFARFLQSLAKQIIATLTQIAIARLLLEVGVGSIGGTAAASGGGLVQGFADGGPIGEPSPGHYGIKAPRPKGLDPTDTVPAWLAPGEYVQRAAAVARYGADFMEALNRGLIDPSTMRATAGLSARRSRDIRRVGRIAGFADGGLISEQIAATAATAASAARAPATTGAPSPAFIVGNDLAADRFLRGGKAAVFDFFREHASSFRAIIGQGQ